MFFISNVTFEGNINVVISNVTLEVEDNINAFITNIALEDNINVCIINVTIEDIINAFIFNVTLEDISVYISNIYLYGIYSNLTKYSAHQMQKLVIHTNSYPILLRVKRLSQSKKAGEGGGGGGGREHKMEAFGPVPR